MQFTPCQEPSRSLAESPAPAYLEQPVTAWQHAMRASQVALQELAAAQSPFVKDEAPSLDDPAEVSAGVGGHQVSHLDPYSPAFCEALPP